MMPRLVLSLALCAACGVTYGSSDARLPLVLVADVDLPGGATRFDYQDIDSANGQLAIAHMGDSEVVIVSLTDGATLGRISGIATVRGIAVGGTPPRIFATAAGSSELVSIDAATRNEIGRVPSGSGPDGVVWDAAHRIVAVSDQRSGSIALIDDDGAGSKVEIPLGDETGNVVYDAARELLWITVVTDGEPDRLVAVDPVTRSISTRIDLPGCEGAHGLRLHPDGESALVACEGNDVLARAGLDGEARVVTAEVGAGPDVLSIDPGLSWIYVAAESGDLTVFDLAQEGLVAISREHPGDVAHSVAVDPATHRVFFPLAHGPNGSPVLRIMRPAVD